jgi:hypothetical protein
MHLAFEHGEKRRRIAGLSTIANTVVSLPIDSRLKTGDSPLAPPIQSQLFPNLRAERRLAGRDRLRVSCGGRDLRRAARSHSAIAALASPVASDTAHRLLCASALSGPEATAAS